MRKTESTQMFRVFSDLLKCLGHKGTRKKEEEPFRRTQMRTKPKDFPSTSPVKMYLEGDFRHYQKGLSSILKVQFQNAAEYHLQCYKMDLKMYKRKLSQAEAKRNLHYRGGDVMVVLVCGTPCHRMWGWHLA